MDPLLTKREVLCYQDWRLQKRNSRASLSTTRRSRMHMTNFIAHILTLTEMVRAQCFIRAHMLPQIKTYSKSSKLRNKLLSLQREISLRRLMITSASLFLRSIITTWVRTTLEFQSNWTVEVGVETIPMRSSRNTGQGDRLRSSALKKWESRVCKMRVRIHLSLINTLLSLKG